MPGPQGEIPLPSSTPRVRNLRRNRRRTACTPRRVSPLLRTPPVPRPLLVAAQDVDLGEAPVSLHAGASPVQRVSLARHAVSCRLAVRVLEEAEIREHTSGVFRAKLLRLAVFTATTPCLVPKTRYFFPTLVCTASSSSPPPRPTSPLQDPNPRRVQPLVAAQDIDPGSPSGSAMRLASCVPVRVPCRYTASRRLERR